MAAMMAKPSRPAKRRNLSRHGSRHDPLLLTQPWRVMAVFAPVEQVIARIERDGTIDAAGGMAVFKEDNTGGWYDLIAALNGVIEFHELAASRYGYRAQTAGLAKLASKLHHGAPVFDSDLAAAKQSIVSCKQQAMRLRVSQAVDLVDTVRISMEFDRLGVTA